MNKIIWRFGEQEVVYRLQHVDDPIFWSVFLRDHVCDCLIDVLTGNPDDMLPISISVVKES